MGGASATGQPPCRKPKLKQAKKTSEANKTALPEPHPTSTCSTPGPHARSLHEPCTTDPPNQQPAKLAATRTIFSIQHQETHPNRMKPERKRKFSPQERGAARLARAAKICRLEPCSHTKEG
ncbi:hypothetical protein GOP47_0009073 [Adiantum capillus-veneris]|uniref:Uncharacterized protein n=1 Tax=Adiantum capillus-veneris TaxID=13818 RepID=A0A9D4UZR4_ADICA|nr:hypothetical protein GOP47_0009073 [Adiantum capillus-veneris]